jgi:3-dehydroquinate dehydratase-2
VKILVINGPNLDLLGTREPDVYGRQTLAEAMERVVSLGKTLGVDVEAYQSNHEGELITRIGRSSAEYDGLIINPAAFTHTSVAIRDALAACGLPCVEVHISNTHKRESFRHTSLTAPCCLGQIMGFGVDGYCLAVQGLVTHLGKEVGR